MTQNKVKTYRQFFSKKGRSASEAQSLALRTVLLEFVIAELRKQNCTQKEAALKLGVKQPRISEIYSGSIDKFSSDLLVTYLLKLGKEVNLTLADRK
jgi:predicted XRE-type DNA-binding protein